MGFSTEKVRATGFRFYEIEDEIEIIKLLENLMDPKKFKEQNFNHIGPAELLEICFYRDRMDIEVHPFGDCVTGMSKSEPVGYIFEPKDDKSKSYLSDMLIKIGSTKQCEKHFEIYIG
jgi:hypothetical protein